MKYLARWRCSALAPTKLRVRSESDPEVEYRVFVSMHPDQCVCTCPDFRFRQKEGPHLCKHIAWVMARQCDWAGLEPERYEGRPRCPRCGGPAQEYVEVR